MTKNRPEIQTIPTNQKDFQADRVLLLTEVTEIREKADPSHFLKFLLADYTNSTFGFASAKKTNTLQNQKNLFFAHAPKNSVRNIQLISKV